MHRGRRLRSSRDHHHGTGIDSRGDRPIQKRLLGEPPQRQIDHVRLAAYRVGKPIEELLQTDAGASVGDPDGQQAHLGGDSRQSHGIPLRHHQRGRRRPMATHVAGDTVPPDKIPSEGIVDEAVAVVVHPRHTSLLGSVVGESTSEFGMANGQAAVQEGHHHATVTGGGPPGFGGTDVGTNKPGRAIDGLPRVDQRPLIGKEGLQGGVTVEVPDPVGDLRAHATRNRCGTPQATNTMVPSKSIGHQDPVGTGRTRVLPL